MMFQERFFPGSRFFFQGMVSGFPDQNFPESLGCPRTEAPPVFADAMGGPKASDVPKNPFRLDQNTGGKGIGVDNRIPLKAVSTGPGRGGVLGSPGGSIPDSTRDPRNLQQLTRFGLEWVQHILRELLEVIKELTLGVFTQKHLAGGIDFLW